jgi:hypothetical protein
MLSTNIIATAQVTIAILSQPLSTKDKTKSASEPDDEEDRPSTETRKYVKPVLDQQW